MIKKIFLVLVTASLFSCEKNNDELQNSIYELNKNLELFEESVEILPQGRVNISNGKYAKIFKLKIHDSKYKPLKSYSLNGEEFIDDGRLNDQIAGDGIYTSVFKNDSDIKFDLNHNITFKSEKFKYINHDFNQKNAGGEFGCKIKHVTSGKSLLGFSCGENIGCFELYDCSFKITW